MFSQRTPMHHNTQNYTTWFVIFTTALLFSLTTCKDVVLLKRGSEIICAHKNISLPIFLRPPILTNTTIQNAKVDLVKENWLITQWETKHSTNISLRSVTDKRWEDFPITFTNYHRWTSIKSVSVSLYAPKIVKFFMNDEKGNNYHDTHITNSSTWVHFTIFYENNNVYIMENNEILHKQMKLNPTRTVIKTAKKTFWKIHDYEMKVATKVSPEKTIVQLPRGNLSCLMLYVNLCPHCKLQIENNERSYHLLGQDAESENLYTWQQLNVSTKPGSNLELSRQTIDNSEEGFWAIEFRQCSNVFKRNIGSEAIFDGQTCEAITQFPSMNSANETSCHLGRLGHNCEFTCQELLGSDHKNCEGYQICKNNFSHCSTGSTCTKNAKLWFHALIIWILLFLTC